MRIQEVVNHWESASKGERTPQEFSIKLPLKEAAQVMALKDMYPDCRGTNSHRFALLCSRGVGTSFPL